MRSFELIRVYLFVVLVLFSVIVCEMMMTPMGLPPGTLIGVLQVSTSLLGLGIVLDMHRSQKERPALAKGWLWPAGVGLAHFAIADFFWTWLFYWHHMERTTVIAAFLVHLPYAVGYCSLALAMYRASGSPVFRDFASSLSVSAILLGSLPFFIKFLLWPTLHRWMSEGMTWFLWAHSLNTLGCYFLLLAALVTLVRSRDFYWSLLASGALTLVLENWSFRADYILFKSASYGFYDFLWTFGLMSVVFSLVVAWRRRHTLKSIPAFSWNSLVTRGRATILGFILGSLAILSVFTVPSSLVFKVFALASSMAAILAVFLSHFFTEKVQDLAYWLSLEVVDSLEVLGSAEMTKRRPLPIELHSIYCRHFEQRARGMRWEQMRRKRMGELAAQLAHDIRSPLAALEMVVEQLCLKSSQCGEERELFQASFLRLSHIAEGFLHVHRASSMGTTQEEPVVSSHSIHEVVRITNEVLDEKRAEFSDRRQLSFELKILCSREKGPVRLIVSEYQRALSNVLNNSVQAMGGRGRIQVFVQDGEDYGQIQVRVLDQGGGISPEKLKLIGRPGVSFGKRMGHGLGLSHARSSLESWGGLFEIESVLGLGTAVTMTLTSVGPQA